MGKAIYEQLDELYKAEWAKISKDLEQYKDLASMPFLPTTQKVGGSSDESWWTDAKLRVMIFGRETGKNFNTPLSQVESDLLAEAGELYAQWNDGVQQEDGANGFFGAFRYFAKNLPQAAIMWNNLDLVACAKEDGSLSKKNQTVYDVQAKFSTAVLTKMLELLKPDVVIFLTSESRDGVITRDFGTAGFAVLDERFGNDKLAWVKNFPVAKVAYRANHPVDGLSNDVKDAIIADIEENFKK